MIVRTALLALVAVHLCLGLQSVQRSDAYSVQRASISSLPGIMLLASNEFRVNCKTPKEQLELHVNIVRLFTSKFLFPQEMAHSIISVTEKSSGSLVGFVDLSLQTCDGSLDALQPESLSKRKTKYEKLAPYLSNLLVVPAHRRKGLASQLVNACIEEAVQWGHDSMYLHVDPHVTAALALYISKGFVPQRRVGEALFMKLSISRSVLSRSKDPAPLM